jgi:hypothetical protein
MKDSKVLTDKSNEIYKTMESQLILLNNEYKKQTEEL